MASFLSGQWRIDARERLVAAVRGELQPYESKATLVWRTMPFVCATSGGWDPRQSPLAQQTSAEGAKLACEEGLPLVDWRSASCHATAPGRAGLIGDGVHWHPNFYRVFTNALVQGDFAPACEATQDDCERTRC